MSPLLIFPKNRKMAASIMLLLLLIVDILHHDFSWEQTISFSTKPMNDFNSGKKTLAITVSQGGDNSCLWCDCSVPAITEAFVVFMEDLTLRLMKYGDLEAVLVQM